MGHNVSRDKQEQIRRNRQVAALEPFLVPGWQIDRAKGEVVPVATVLGALQRGQEILLKCGQADCRRRVTVDLRAAVQAGLGDRSTQDLARLLRCQHWAGCRLEEISAAYPKGVPLIAYLNHPDVLIGVTCGNCGHRLLLPPAAMIAKLRAAGRGDGSTGVIELGSVVRGPCRKCWHRQFASEVVWAKALGTG